MKEKFKWGKFILDCFICFSIVIISPFVLFYVTQPISDSNPIQWLLYPIQLLLYPVKLLFYPIKWLLYPIQWLGIQWLDASAILWVTALSIISFVIINIFYKIHKLSLILNLIFMICYATLVNYFFAHL